MLYKFPVNSHQLSRWIDFAITIGRVKSLTNHRIRRSREKASPDQENDGAADAVLYSRRD